MAGAKGEREFEVVVYGATGYTGVECCKQLALLGPKEGLGRWAISGRSQARLEALAEELAAQGPRPAVEAVGTDDAEGLRRLLARAAVVLNVAGPYALVSGPVVEAAIDAGTDYVDVTGESKWVREMARQHHAAAAEKGVLLVHQCGFDSTLADFGSRFAMSELRHRGGGPAVSCAGYFVMGGTPTVTNGTLNSILEGALGSAPPSTSAPEGCPPLPRGAPELKRLPKAAHACPVPGAPPGARGSPSEQPDVPMVMWSHDLQGGQPQDFEYMQYMIFDGRVPCLRKLEFCGIALAGAACGWWPGQAGVCARRFLVGLRGRNAGPTAEDVECSSTVALFEAKDAEGKVARARVEVCEAYRFTALAAVSGALCLLRARAELPMQSGFAPPAAGLGEPMFQRLKQHALFSTVE